MGGGGRRPRRRRAGRTRGDGMAAVRRLFRLPPSPIENSVEGRAFVFAGFAVSVLAIVLYGQDYVVPVIGVLVAAAGHVVSYRERNSRRTFWRQALLAALVFGALFYVLTDSALALFGGVLPQANIWRISKRGTRPS